MEFNDYVDDICHRTNIDKDNIRYCINDLLNKGFSIESATDTIIFSWNAEQVAHEECN